MAGTTGLEPATSAVTGQRSDQLSYVPRLFFNNLVIRHIESSASQLSLFSLFSTISLLWTQFRVSVDTTWTPRWTPNQVNATTESSLPDTFYFWCPPSPLHRSFQDLGLSKPLQFRGGAWWITQANPQPLDRLIFRSRLRLTGEYQRRTGRGSPLKTSSDAQNRKRRVAHHGVRQIPHAAVTVALVASPYHEYISIRFPSGPQQRLFD